jgi:hypothetical protein
VAEGGALLRRYTGKTRIEGSNPSLSAITFIGEMKVRGIVRPAMACLLAVALLAGCTPAPVRPTPDDPDRSFAIGHWPDFDKALKRAEQRCASMGLQAELTRTEWKVGTFTIHGLPYSWFECVEARS